MPSRMLAPNNPNAAKNHMNYNFSQRKFVKDELVDQL